MKLIIAGSRTLNPGVELITQLMAFFDCFPTEVVSGAARGVDRAGEAWADAQMGDEFFPVKQFHADWETHGKAAGVIRNAEMAEYADALLLIWDGSSKGSANMKREMTILNKPIYEVILR